MKVNDIVKAKIIYIRPYGLFLETDDGCEGLLHISEISERYIKNIYLLYTKGQYISVKILKIDENSKHISFTLKGMSLEEKELIEAPLNDSTKLLKNIGLWIKNYKKEDKNMKLNLNYVKNPANIKFYEEKVKTINHMINEKTGLGAEYLGWTTYPADFDKAEVARIIKKAKYVRDNFEVLVVCGIGGSYLGARAAIEAINGVHSADKLEIIYMGQTFSSNYISSILTYLEHKKFAINVISKSGTTTETSVSFRLLKELLEKQLGKEKAREAIIATTDKAKGALKELAKAEGYETYVLPDDIGGRYSVLTAVGLFPIACAGIDINLLLEGAHDAMIEFDNDDIYTNKAYQYAILRDSLYRSGKSVEMFINYEPCLVELNEWLKQLFGETEGKDKKGLLPDSAHFTTDLHSLGQFIQEGSPILFETVLYFHSSSSQVLVPHDNDNLDGLNYLEGKSLDYINEKAFLGTLDAHANAGGVDNIVLEFDKLDTYTLGYMFYFFMRVVAMSAYLLEINPFNQPGVEIYKKNMFHLLGKKGY
ncbi:MAG: glucose-6-phosphate isomerase [Bacilli bacterium]